MLERPRLTYADPTPLERVNSTLELTRAIVLVIAMAAKAVTLALVLVLMMMIMWALI